MLFNSDFSSSSFFSDHFKKFKAYVPGEQPLENNIIKLNTNENPFSACKEIKKNLKKTKVFSLHLYPDPTCKKMTLAASKCLKIPKNNIVFGNGSDELIASIFRIFFNPDEKVILTKYTYGAYQVYADLYNTKVGTLDMDKDFRILLDRLKKISGKVFFLTNPNAPTGITLSTKEIEESVKENSDKLFVIDEAYSDFANEDCTQLALKYPNVIVLKTFSKGLSLCGIRLGYAVANKEIIDAFKKSLDPYNINTITQNIATTVFKNYKYYKKNIKKVISIRENFVSQMTKIGFQTLPSASNFVFTRHPNFPNAEPLFDYLKKNKVLVRFFKENYLNEYLRISIGTSKQMQKVVRILKKKVNKI